MYDDDRDALAAEYVLGTLSADERDQAEALLAIDPAFAEIVRVWERRLGELNVMVEAVEPPAEVWEKIKAEIAGPETATQAPRLTTEEEFSFPPIEETAPQTVPDLAAAKPPEAAVAETPAQEPHEHYELHEHHESQEQPEQPEPEQPEPEQHEPDEHDQRSEPGHPIPLIGDESLDDLLAAPLPEAPRDLDEPSEAPASSLLPPEAESAAKSDLDEKPDDFEGLDFESDLKAVVLQDLSRDGLTLEDLSKDGSGKEANSAAEPPTPQRDERGADVIALERKARRWRGLTAAMTAIAALLALYVGVSKFAPGLMPVSRPAPPPTVTAQVVPPPPSRLVAVLQQDPTTPAFLVSVDPVNRTLTVRRVSAAPEQSRSYELWLISNKYPAPRSLGLVGASEFTSRMLPAGFDTDTIKSASYAISLEPAGGSTTGAPTGPILFKGHMVEALPGSSG
ncbi:MAG TPA: anti-sigma factor [Xanthobacteraceae bacterium]|jgi:anti-sigma-K factor RskA|nr:anti-sigma factor [Xanthobacteraceae bacterium]